MVAEKYEYGIDFGAVEAIDIHTHVEVDCHGHNAYDDELVDYPYVQLDRWRKDFAALDLDPEIGPLIFKENALRVLGLR